jgi:hypothetical protein
MRHKNMIPVTLLFALILNSLCLSQTLSDKPQNTQEGYLLPKVDSHKDLKNTLDVRSSPNITETHETYKKKTSHKTEGNEFGNKDTFKQFGEIKTQDEISTDVQKIQEKAARGDDQAKYELGQLYLEGKNVEQNIEAAKQWFNSAAIQGNSNAQFTLGQMFMNGTAGAKDHTEAAKWFQQAAENGNFQAQYNFGGMYIIGLGVKKDYKRAASWTQKAALQGDVYAQYRYALMYENGIGVDRDVSNAYKWYSVANSLMREDYNENIESLIIKMKEADVKRVLQIAKELSTKTQNIRNVYSSGEILIISGDFIDDYIKNLESGYIAYLYPEKMKLSDHKKVSLIMSYNEIDSNRLVSSNEKYKIVFGRAKIHDRMGAKLSGTAFQIHEGDFTTQFVPQGNETNWNWPFNPLNAGPNSLYLSLNIMFSAFGKDMPYKSKEIEFAINVKPSPWYRIILKYILDNIIVAIFVGVIVGVIVVIIARKILGKNSNKNEPKQ